MREYIRNSNYPSEIVSFIYSVFEVYEIRGQVGRYNGIVFKIRTNEKNHTLPHVHAEYGEYSISIEIKTGRVLDGNLPNKNQKIAVNWVLNNQEELMHEWKDIAISALDNMTMTALDFTD